MSGVILLGAEEQSRNLSGSSFSSLFAASGMLIRNFLHSDGRVMWLYTLWSFSLPLPPPNLVHISKCCPAHLPSDIPLSI